MKKVLSCCIFILIFIFSSCSPKSSAEYFATRISGADDDVFYEKSNDSSSLEIEKYVDNSISNQKTVILKEKSVDMSYDISMKRNGEVLHIYKSNDENVKCYYRANQVDLSQIVFYNQEIEYYKTEPEFRTWINEILAEYGIHNLEDYTFSCTSRILVYGDDSLSSKVQDGFHIPENENEKLSSYTFEFVKFIDGYPTTDKISVYLNMSGTIIIKFDDNKFASVSEIDINQPSVENALKNYLFESINKDKYEFKSYNINNEYVTFIGENMCYIYSIELTLIAKNGTDEITTLVDIAVYLNITNSHV